MHHGVSRAAGTLGILLVQPGTVSSVTSRPPRVQLLPWLLLLILSLARWVSAQLDGPSSALLSPGFTGPLGATGEGVIVLANRGLRVPFGRAVWLDPLHDLVLQVQPGDRCQVVVLDNDALSQLPGHLSPKRFPCDFGPGEVSYSHLGARSPSRDRVRLQLRYDTPSGSVVLPLVLEVEVLFTQLEIVTRNLPLVVEELLGTSNPLDRRSLEFTYQPETEECRVGILSGLGALPRYGKLLHYSQALGIERDRGRREGLEKPQMMDCNTFLELGVQYLHTAPGRSPNRDWVPMVVELHPRGAPSGSPSLKREHFQVLVRIRGGTENTPPKPSFVAMMMMEVDQFVLTALTPDMLAAEDSESDPDLLVFNLTSPFQQGQGYLVSTDDRSLPLSSFTQRDLRLLKIAYQPPAEDSDQERLFELELEVVDPEGVASDPFAFMVVVKPMNTLAPVVTRNTGLILYEGQSRPLTGPPGSGPSNLIISDEDDLDTVQLEVIAGLQHGHLALLGAHSGDPGSGPPRKHFTVAELEAGQVVYQHDDSDGSLSDNLVLRMVDGGGRHQVQFLFPITLVPVDDQPPVLNANTGLVLAEGDTVPIPPLALSATDIDSDDSMILFVLESPYSTTGQLLLRQAHPPRDGEELNGGSWRQLVDPQKGILYERSVTEWRQQDIVEGRLFYQHIGPHSPGMGPVTDQFVFRVQDDHDPPNQSGLQKFVLRIHPVDRLPPELGSGCPLRMVVQEYQLTPLRKKWLRYTDLDTDDRELRYIVTQPPTDTDENHAPTPLGALVLTDNPLVAVTHFTQAQINHHKIAYRPPDQELGVAARVAQFQYQVEDQAGNVVPGTFTFYLQPVDNQPPEILNTGFTIQERGRHILSETELHATDVDTEASRISFTLTQAPKHGQLQLSQRKLVVGELFHLDDIVQGRVAYVHNGDESPSDSCSISVSDGLHVVPITLRANVRPVDDEVPLLSLPAGTLGSYLDVLENEAAEITAHVIKGTDEDTDDFMLTFLLENPPLHGEILVNGVPAEQFSQRDILEGSVVYAHTSGEIGPFPKEDSFNLTLSDMSQEWRIGGNIVQGVTVLVTILPIDNQAPEVTVGEQFMVVEGDKRVITTSHISAEDIDSPNDDILCTIVTQPISGYVENISPAPGSEKSRAGIAISAFTLKDLKQGHIYYVQSIHKSVEPVEDRFAFRCSDGINFSHRHFFPIVIIPTNDEQPEMFMREFMVMEGMSLVIDTPILNAADGDIPADDLTFIITHFPSHGHIMNQLINGTVLVESFTLDQIIESSSIIYEHDDSETQEDSFAIKLTDGKYSVEKRVIILVIPVDDETPRMTINNGLEIEMGETKIINNRVLMATDLDSEDKSLAYIVRYGPGHGLLQRQRPDGAVENITLGMNFTQDEVDRDLIQYVHLGQEGIRDLIKFDVTDGINPLIDRYFYVSIGSIDMVFPDVISKGVSLKEGGRVTLTTDLLSTSDLNSPDENLVFSITRAPVRGHLECTDKSGVPIISFTQLQLAGNKIYYIHTSDDEVKMDSFEFEVTDGRNSVFRTFRISISDVDNKKPVVTIHNLVVSESENKLITPFELTVEDRDTPDHLLKFTVTQVPVHGYLMFNNSRPVMVFTKQDLNENLISYKHDGTESTEDSFSFTVTDGTHADFYVFPDTVFETRRPQMMKIRVIAVDNSSPQIVVNKGAPTLRILTTGHLGFMITNKILKVEDKDSLHISLKFIVTGGPHHGFLFNLGKGNHSVAQFTQADIDDMKICYVLREGANATSDSFHFTVEDGGGNKLTNQHFHLNWAWISLEKEYYLVNEDFKFLDIVLKRRGYLGETSFVSIGTQDGTAKKDRDFKGKAQKQVQFNPGQTTATWRVRILSDGEHEQSETFQVVLSEPVMAALEFPAVTTVEIIDPGDESTVFIPQSVYTIEEDIGELFIPIRRSGDVSQELMVICYTRQGTATGTVPTSVLSYSDYISRPEDHTSVLRFDKDEREKTCRIVIIDDSLYEEGETFHVLLSMPMGGRIGSEFPEAQVTIIPDKDDEPTFYFGAIEYSVDESAGFVEVHIWRTGTDLSRFSSVMVRSRKSEPPSADAGTDYVGISRNLDFPPGVNMQTLRVIILDDRGQPILEGVEKFELVLRMPMNAALGEPNKATIFINDSASDLPKMQFKERVYSGNENDGQIVAMIYRSGDIQHRSSVRCYTRQGSAQVMMDFEERPNTDSSIITFLPGETEKPCILVLMDDVIYEEEEELRLVLGTPQSESPFGASVGEQNETLIKIRDDADRTIIKLGETKFSVREPKGPSQSVIVKIPVLRQGDTSKVSIVRVHTKDGSAVSGEDYHPVSEEIEFKEGETQHIVEIEVLFDGVSEMREAFTVHLKPDENMVAETQATKAIVYIEEMNSMADVTFPSVPQVVSLLIYDDIFRIKDSPGPVPGYPVACITACNPKYSDYEKTGSICSSESINDTLTRYRWLVSAPTGPDGVTSPMKEVDFDTFFTSSKMITLDSIYFQAGSRVQCAARAVNTNGNEGLELMSPIVTVNREEGLCQPRVPGVVGAEPFSAKLRYTGSEDADYTNLIKLTVTMPHIDGMLPVISTRELSNFELTLSPDGTRVGNHRCSNLLDYTEVKTHHGFLTDATRNSEVIGETYPYQYSAAMRGSGTLRFYRNLNLEACLWEFVSYYDMSELLTDCGGTIGTDGQVLNLVQSYVTLRVPLYVSYVFHSPVGVGGWQHFDLKSELRLTFVYDTAILWNDGIGSPPEAELQGSLYPTSMRISEEGRLVVNFKTEARFHGLFVLSHPASSTSSMIISADHPGLTFSLRLIRSEPTYNQPVQQWSFVSDFSVRDYSGTYTVKLIPCTTSPHQEYSSPVICNPRELNTFDLDIRFQQVSDPVAAEFSLNTQMFLLSKKSLWLSDGSMGFGQESDVAFTEGDIIYGRVMVDPVQNLGDSFYCSIEKVFLCTGADGYVPKYSPSNAEYGCLADSPSLLYRFKIVDKAQPETQATSFGNVLFNAKLAADDPEAVLLVKQPGSDGFKVDSTPLFQVSLGREWYIHTIYTVRSKDNINRGIGKRSAEYQYHSLSSSGILRASTQNRKKREARNAPQLAKEIGAENNRGTNIQHIALDRTNRRQIPQREVPLDGVLPRELNSSNSEVNLITVITGVATGLLTICLIAITVLLLKRKQSSKKKEAPAGSGSTEPMMPQNRYTSDSSEV
ncbi:LOW QUALITY PROTEIN: FRAS1-related extracellular matrix protein 2 [Phascolarctos cinereus]|uniref:FRAS1-related extracellular matrix protein 2 n=1 Tax=Phascolarctos cinereus TaxID=38626 RepID=A0A6P5IU32_PHACI|nr:LOW QUALITY PROTEIN: FRAS1-related extracellular matrix protein 2 [Phascolarctos cinereus]